MMNFEFEGWIRCVVRRPDGSVRTDTGWFHNLILNQGLNRLGLGAPVNRMKVGSGSSTPSAGQTALDVTLATSYFQPTVGNPNEAGSNIAGGYAWRRQTYRFAPGGSPVTGNISEVAAAWDAADNEIFSRALILDGSGNPTTITVLSDETLDVSYELRIYWPIGDSTATLVLDGVTTTFTIRPSDVGGWHNAWPPGFNPQGFAAPTGSSAAIAFGPGALGAMDVGPGGTYLSPTSAAIAVGAYVNNSYQRTFRVTWGLANGTTDFHNIRFDINCGYMKASASPPIPKTGSKQLVLDIQITWARKTI